MASSTRKYLIEREESIRKVVAECDGVVYIAADVLGMSPGNLSAALCRNRGLRGWWASFKRARKKERARARWRRQYERKKERKAMEQPINR